MLKKLLLIMLLISTPAISFSMCNPCTLIEGPSYQPTDITVIEDIAFSSRCNLLAVATNAELLIYRVNQEDCSLTLVASIPQDVLATSVSFSPRNDCLAVGRASNVITVFPINLDCTLGEGVDYPASAGVTTVRQVKFSPDGSCLAAVVNGVPNPGDQSIDLFTVTTADSQCSLSIPTNFPTIPVTQNIRDIAFSPSGNCLVASVQPANLTVFRVVMDNQGNCALANATSVTNPDLEFPSSLSFSSDGNCLVVVNGSLSAGIMVFSVEESPNVCNLADATPFFIGEDIRLIRFSPVGNCLVIYSRISRLEGALRIFNVTPGCNFVFNPPSVSILSNLSSLEFTPNGHCLALAGQPGGNAGTQGTIYMFSTNIMVSPVITQAIPQCDRTVIVTGTATPGLSVQIFVDGSSMGGSVVIGAGGTFEVIVGPLSLGTHTITAVATNTDTGCSSVISNAVEVTVTAGPAITNVRTTCLNTVIISGTAVPGIPVSILVDDNLVPVGMGLLNDAGIFTIATQPVVSGPHCFTAVQAGCPSAMPVCVDITGQSCTLSGPNLAFGTHCNV